MLRLLGQRPRDGLSSIYLHVGVVDCGLGLIPGIAFSEILLYTGDSLRRRPRGLGFVGQPVGDGLGVGVSQFLARRCLCF